MIWSGFFAGIAWVLIYNTIEAIRNFFDRGKVLRIIEDILIAIAFAVTTYSFMYVKCGGVVRGYNYISLIGGIATACIVHEKIMEKIYVRRAEKRAIGEKE